MPSLLFSVLAKLTRFYTFWYDLHCLRTLPYCQLQVQLCICIRVICAQAAGWKLSRNWHDSQEAVSAVTSFVPVHPLHYPVEDTKIHRTAGYSSMHGVIGRGRLAGGLVGLIWKV